MTAGAAVHQPNPTPDERLSRRPHDEASDDADLTPIGGWLDEAPAWLMSAALHLLVLILATLLAFGAGDDSRLELTAVFSDDLGEQDLVESDELADSLDMQLDEAVLESESATPTTTPVITPTLLQPTPLGETASQVEVNTALSASLTGRDPSMREALLKAYGGTEETEAAVIEGLKWLERKQQANGSWSLVGPYLGPGRTENRNAATAMALLAFQGAGKLPDGTDKLSRPVRDGWDWLSQQQNSDGAFLSAGAQDHQFYTHALCTIALCELLAMTGDDQWRPAAQRAIDYLVETQAEEGGWRYRPNDGSDLSVTGWVMMALKSGSMARLHVPSSTFDRINDFLDSVSTRDGSRYKYVEYEVYNPESMPTMTSVGLLCRQYLGWPRSDDRLHQGVEHILRNPPEWGRRRTNVYYWYYATQVCKHMGNPMWSEWNGVMRELLPKHQEKKGRERGSWPPDGDRWGFEGGRLYQTCLSLYILEVV